MGSVYFILHFGLQVKLADPDIVSNHNEYQKLAQSMAELEEVSQFVWFGHISVPGVYSRISDSCNLWNFCGLVK